MRVSLASHGLITFQDVKSITAYATPGLKSAVHIAVDQNSGSDDIMIYLSDSILAARLIDAINTVVGERATELLEASAMEDA